MSARGDALASIVYDAQRLDEYWNIVRAAVTTRKSEFESLDGVGLQKFFMWTQYPTLYGKEGQETLLANLNNPKVIERLAGQRVPTAEAYEAWTGATAEGLGFGIMYPEEAHRMLELDHATVNPEIWSQAHRSGLAIPAQQDSLSLQERTSDILDAVREFVQSYYPDLSQPLGW